MRRSFTYAKISSRGTALNICWRLGSTNRGTDYMGWTIDDVAGIGLAANGEGIADRSKRAGVTLSVAPSLIHRAASIRYSLPKDGLVNLKLYDLTGRLTRNLAAGQHKAGAYVVPLDAAGLARGVYILWLEAGAFRATRKVIVE